MIESRGRLDMRSVFQLRKFLIGHKIDILHTHNYKSDIIGALAVQCGRVPLVTTAHGYTEMNRKVSAYEKLDRWVVRHFFKKVAVVTDKILSDFPSDKRVVIANGLDIKQFQKNASQRKAVRERYGIQNDEMVIATVGRLSVEKNQAMLVEAASRLTKKFPNVRFLIVGAGPEEQQLRRLITEKKLERQVILTGFIKDMPSVYSAIDIFVLTSLTEGIPLTILEAMAANVPVVATRVGGIPDLIEDEKTGLLVESRNVAELCAQLETLISDASKRNELAESASRYVRSHFSQEKMVEGYRKVYEEIV
ncbi:MAG: hypothetical protein A2Y04_00120 [Omnitrophica WOR_2 bacterium GWC2_45_7]|nr:MAG: hypothetical protein A2Y04_00120 [Omnitrophica WOR_2 bacterium GWC2_45_7]